MSEKTNRWSKFVLVGGAIFGLFSPVISNFLEKLATQLGLFENPVGMLEQIVGFLSTVAENRFYQWIVCFLIGFVAGKYIYPRIRDKIGGSDKFDSGDTYYAGENLRNWAVRIAKSLEKRDVIRTSDEDTTINYKEFSELESFLTTLKKWG